MSKNIEISKLFDGENSDQQNALITALMECGKDYAKKENRLPHDNSFYEWMEKTNKTALVINAIDKLNELGYQIVKKDGK
jgi:hypothetical protein